MSFLPYWTKESLRITLDCFNFNYGSFINEFAEDLNKIRQEFYEEEISQLRQNAQNRLSHSGLSRSGELGIKSVFAVYAFLRISQPEIIVETGVANGFSTLHFLKAIELNEKGHLHSVDFPFHANESLENFRKKTFPEYGGAAIPEDRDPGWLIPDNLRRNWSLKLGKSQRKLPELINQINGDIDLFFHDSEHSTTAMLFEFDLAWNHMNSDGFIISDDITKNNAFNIFKKERRVASSGFVTRIPPVGYLRK